MEKNKSGISWYLAFKQPPEKCVESSETKNESKDNGLS